LRKDRPTMNLKEMQQREMDAAQAYIKTSRTLRIAARPSGIFLIIDSNQEFRDFLQVVVLSAGRRVMSFPGMADAMKYLQVTDPKDVSCILVEMSTVGNGARSFREWIHSELSNVPFFFYVREEEQREKAANDTGTLDFWFNSNRPKKIREIMGNLALNGNVAMA